MNVHHASLFPDLIGASEYCNILTAEAEQAAEIARLAARQAASTVEATEEASAVEAPTPESGGATAQSIEDILRQPAEAAQVEPGRIGLIAQELAKAIEQNKVVDWDTRDAVQARLRTAVRVLLRKLGYPTNAREAVVEHVLALTVAESKKGGTHAE
jgi:hypothetical protein